MILTEPNLKRIKKKKFESICEDLVRCIKLKLPLKPLIDGFSLSIEIAIGIFLFFIVFYNCLKAQTS